MKRIQIKKSLSGYVCGSSNQKLICCAANFNKLVGSAIKQVQEQKIVLKYNLNETKRTRGKRENQWEITIRYFYDKKYERNLNGTNS